MSQLNIEPAVRWEKQLLGQCRSHLLFCQMHALLPIMLFRETFILSLAQTMVASLQLEQNQLTALSSIEVKLLQETSLGKREKKEEKSEK